MEVEVEGGKRGGMDGGRGGGGEVEVGGAFHGVIFCCMICEVKYVGVALGPYLRFAKKCQAMRNVEYCDILGLDIPVTDELLVID